MEKKSQVTLIIALALLILIIAAFIIYAGNYFKKSRPEPLIFERANLESYISSCVKGTAENGLLQLGKRGFTIDKPEITSIEKMQGQLADYINSNLNECLDDFRKFEKAGWDVEKGTVNAKAQINEKDVSFDVNYPIKVVYNGNTLSFEKFASIADVRLKYIHELATGISEFKFKYGKEVDLTALSEYDLEVTIFPDKGYFVYVIDDPKSPIMNEPYRFILKIKA